MKANSIILAIALFALVTEEGHAGPVRPLATFTAGTPAKASEVNGNFGAVATAVNDNDSRITAIESRVTPDGNVVLVPSTATTGKILKGIFTFIHDFGTENTFVGVSAGNFTMTGGGNTASGVQALQNNTSGNNNTAAGAFALQLNTSGSSNTANGVGALSANVSGSNNTASGNGALHNNTSSDNTASGALALFNNTSGNSNTASGAGALQSNATGNFNTASGAGALSANFNGIRNTAIGSTALFVNSSGNGNTAIGDFALVLNTTGSHNIAIGADAGSGLNTGDFNIDIGNVGVPGESHTIRIGRVGTQTATFIAGIRGVTTGGAAIPVLVDTNGQLGTVSSSRRVKDDIADMGEASSTLMKLRPVTFHYKSDMNPKERTLQYGLVAEEVAKVAPRLVAHSADGEIETVFYQFLAPMLLNEFQKQQRTIEAQTARIAELEQHQRMQTARIEALEKQAMEFAELKQRAARIAA